MEKNITIYDIAQKAGVSPSTVSRVINNKGRVSEITRSRIGELIKLHNYHPNEVARALQTKNSNCIGFIVPDITNPYFSEIFYETERLAAEFGYTIFLCNSQSDINKESEILKALIRKQVSAIVFAGGRIDKINCEKKYIDELDEINNKIPVILCSECLRSNCPQLYNDDKAATNEIMKYLNSIGHKKIGFLGGNENVIITVNKRKYFFDIAKEYGIEIKKEWIIDSYYNIKHGASSMKKLLECKELPSAIICINDNVAVGAIYEAIENGIQIPNDISIIGWDGVPLFNAFRPKLTTMATNYSLFAEEIMNIVNSKNSNNNLYKKLITSKLIIGSSTINC